MSGWPGRWFSMTDDRADDSMTNDNGLLFLAGDEAEAYLWFDPNGYDPKTEVRR